MPKKEFLTVALVRIDAGLLMTKIRIMATMRIRMIIRMGSRVVVSIAMTMAT